MTRQLGAHVLDFDADLVTALDNAKRTLDSAAWVGCYETLSKDLTELREIPAFSNLPNLGPVNVTPHKEPPSPEARHLISERNTYDLDLYNWAMQRFGKPASS